LPSLRLAPLLAGLAILTTLAWWLPNRPSFADLEMPDGRISVVSFAPYRNGQSPLTGRFPTSAEVEQDIVRIADRVTGLRTYSAREGDYEVAAMARAHHLKLWQGIWLGSDRVKNQQEIAAGIDLAHRYPDTIERLVVGNEVLLRRDLTATELAADLDRVRAAVAQKVTYADVWEFWETNPQLARHVDIVTIHILPYWEDHPTGIDRAIAHVEDVFRRISARFPDRPIAIGETGWPSRGRWRQDAAPGLVNQAVFLRRFLSLARREGFDACVIEAFDQTWKYQNEGTVGANWGLWTADRAPKFPLTGALIENPTWPRAVAISLLAGLILLATAPVLPTGAQVRLATLAVALGDAIGFAWTATLPDLYDIQAQIAAFGNLTGQVLLAFLILRRAAAILAGHRTPWRNGADTADTIRALLRLRKLPDPAGLCADLCFVFAWTAGFLQLLLVFDPRYRDFPLPSFAVPLVATLGRAWLRDLPRHGGGRAELCVGATLVIGALASTAIEGPANLQALAWNAAALILAAPLLLSCRRSAPT
jgi:exo-beta-1,3-glucanase (GH17 family)